MSSRGAAGARMAAAADRGAALPAGAALPRAVPGSAGAALLLALAAAFHLLLTLPVGGKGLRVGASDLLLPVLAVVALRWWRSRSPRGGWAVPDLYAWLVVLSAWMLFSLGNGYLHTGAWQPWAVINKTAGWFVLIAYLLGGGALWLGAGPRLGARFLQVFLAAGWLIAALEIALFALDWHGLAPELGQGRLEGFAANPNAFGVLLAALLALQAPYLRARRLFPRGVHVAGMACALGALLLSGSRTAWAAFAVAWLVLLAARRVDWRASVAGVLCCAAGALLLFWLPWKLQAVESTSSPERPPVIALRQYRGGSLTHDIGVTERIRSTRHALELWQASPILGIGLGSFYWEERRSGVRYPTTIHTTVLWFLTETGLVGALLFVTFFLVCLRAVWRRARREEADPLPWGVFGVLVTMMAASIAMEITYQRYLWFLLGCALVVERGARPTRPAARVRRSGPGDPAAGALAGAAARQAQGGARERAVVPLRAALVTGATGFIGRALCTRLQEREVRVRGLARTAAGGPWEQIVTADVGAGPLPRGCMDGVDTVFHLAGKVHALEELGGAEAEYVRANVEGTRHALEAAVAAGVKRFVLVSSVKAGGEGSDVCIDEAAEDNPETPYGRSKLEAERLAGRLGRRHGMHVACLRLPLVYGPGDRGNLARMLEAVARRRFPPLPECGNRRSMVHVEDVARAAILVAESPAASGQIYLVTDGRPYSTRELYDLMRRALGRRVWRWSVPPGLLRALARLGDLAGRVRGRRAPFDSDALEKLTSTAWYSSAKIEQELGFRPAWDLERALPEMIESLGLRRRRRRSA